MVNSREEAQSLIAGAGARKGRRRGPPPEMELPRLHVERATHRLHGIPFRASPNCDERPDPSDISLLVVHAISLPPDEFGGPWVEQFFTNRLDPKAHPYFETIKDLKVSAHALVARDGGITQFVPFSQRAWHAGESSFEGCTRCNDFSIGVELEGCDTRPFTDAQYASLIRVAAAVSEAYPAIQPARIVGHSDIAPGRKTDPGPHFDWTRFLYGLEYTR